MALAGTRIPLNCILEPTNRYYLDAIKIVVPSVKNLPAAYHLSVTKPPPRPQRVLDVAGHIVGCVPLDASKIIALIYRITYNLLDSQCPILLSYIANELHMLKFQIG